MTYSFQQATKENIKLRMALYGPPGCGKTYTALQLASILGKKIGLIDTEYGSSRKYANLFDFKSLELLSSFVEEDEGFNQHKWQAVAFMKCQNKRQFLKNNYQICMSKEQCIF